MRGRFRNIGRQQGQLELPFRVTNFQGAENSDIPATEIGPEDFPLMQDMIAFPEWCEGRGGSQKYSNTVLPGSGTVHSYKQHPMSKKWLLHRGTQLWIAAAAMSSWTEVKSVASGSPSIVPIPVVAGDAAGQLSIFELRNVNSSNSNAGVNYWTLTNSGSTRTLTLYQDSAHTQPVAQGSHLNNGQIFLTPLNNSALWGSVYVTYTTDDSDVANTTTIAIEASYGVNVASTIKEFDSDFIVAVGNSSGAFVNRPVIVKMATGIFYNLNNVSNVAGVPYGAGFGPYPFVGTGSQSSGTPYGYRFIYTYCRIVDSSGNPSYSSTRITGALEKESAANFGRTKAGTDTQVDYGEYWVANPISVSNPLAINPTATGDLSAGVPGNNSLHAITSDPHWTHLGLYRTLDIGTNGTDPITGSGNNREVYIWCGDFAIYSTSLSISKIDDEIRSLYAADFGLRTRGWQDMPTGEVFEISTSFMYQATRADNKIYYCQLAAKELAGYYNPAFQFLKLNDGLQVIAKSPDMMTFVCNNKTYISSPNSYFDAGSAATGSIFVLNHLTAADETLGVTDYGSFTKIESGVFIAHCSDHSIRIWNGSKWGPDISSRKVNKLVRQMVNGSAGGYFAGAFFLWYRTDSSQTYNDKCLRYGFGRDNGFGWCRHTGAAWVYPPLNCGAELIQDTNSVQRLLVLDSVDSAFYWIATFNGYTGSGLTKRYLDKVAVDGTGGTNITPKIQFREIIGASLVKRKIVPDEAQTVYLEEVHAFLRAYDESVGFLSGFQINMVAYVDGSMVATETVSNLINKGDWQFWQTIEGKRIQLELNFTTSGFMLIAVEAQYLSQNKQAIGKGPSYTDEATAQKNLASNLKHWLTRPYNLLNRATGTSYTLTGTAPTNVTGPDGRSFALSFITGASYTQADTNSYGDFAVAFWCKTVALSKRIFQITGTNSFYVQFTANTTMDVNGAGNVTVPTIASGFHHFIIVRIGSTVSIYQDGVLNGTTVTVATARGGTSFDINPDGGAMILYDVRVYGTSLVAADDAYLYSDTSSTTLAGNKVLPLA